jgi:hypothetical protein
MSRIARMANENRLRKKLETISMKKPISTEKRPLPSATSHVAGPSSSTVIEQEFAILPANDRDTVLGLTRLGWLCLEQKGCLQLTRATPPGSNTTVYLLPLATAQIALQELALTANPRKSNAAKVMPAAPAPAPAKNPTPPEIAPGVTINSYHGRAWPVRLEARIESITTAVTPSGKPVLKMSVTVLGMGGAYRGEIVTVEGVELRGPSPREGRPDTRTLVVTAPYLVIGGTFEANIRAKLRPSKVRGPDGVVLPDYAKAPYLLAEQVRESCPILLTMADFVS